MVASRFRAALVVTLALFGLSACAELPDLSPTESATAADTTAQQMLGVEKYIGVVVVAQSPQVDRMVRGRNADQYFLDVYRAAKASKPGFVGAKGEVKLTVRSYNDTYFERAVPLDAQGIAKIALPPETRVPQDAALCVETPWPIAHQRVRSGFAVSGQHVACTPGASLYRYLVVDNRGAAPADAFGVIAIKSGG